MENGQIFAGTKIKLRYRYDGQKGTKMKVIPCMYHKNGNNLLYVICHPTNVETTVKEMNERLQNGESKYNGLELNGIDYFYAGETYDEDFSLYD